MITGGAAGAVSRITGTLGKGIAALTLDDDYQKKRREAMNKRPANVGEGFARGGKGLVMVGASCSLDVCLCLLNVGYNNHLNKHFSQTKPALARTLLVKALPLDPLDKTPLRTFWTKQPPQNLLAKPPS